MNGEEHGGQDLHPDRLMWYVAGKLDPDDCREVRAHLQECADCRAEAEALASMRSTLRDLPRREAAHIDVEDLVALEDREPALSSKRRAEMQVHLNGCDACREDLAALVRARKAPEEEAAGREVEARPSDAMVPPATYVPGARRPWAWGLAAAVILAAILIPFAWNPGGPPAPAFTFLPSQRGAEELPALGAGRLWSVEVVLPFEAPDGRYVVWIQTEDGFVVADLPPAESGGGTGRLTLDVPTSEKAGIYVLILRPPTAMPGAPYEYPFRVIPWDASEGGDP